MLILEIQQTTFQQTTNFPACKGEKESQLKMSAADSLNQHLTALFFTKTLSVIIAIKLS